MAGKKLGGNGKAPIHERTNGEKPFSGARPAAEGIRPTTTEEILREYGLADAIEILGRPEPLSGSAKEASEELHLILRIKYPGRDFSETSGDMIAISGILSAGASPEDISERVRLIRRTLRHFPQYFRGIEEQFTDTYPLSRALHDLKGLLENEPAPRLPSLDVALKRGERAVHGSIRQNRYGPPPRMQPHMPITPAHYLPTIEGTDHKDVTYEQGYYFIELAPRFSAVRVTAYALALTAIAAAAAFGFQNCQ
ncbi:MAG: hypothetical protein AB1324_08410 [Candidatus Micrarchaeota archaeon]